VICLRLHWLYHFVLLVMHLVLHSVSHVPLIWSRTLFLMLCFVSHVPHPQQTVGLVFPHVNVMLVLGAALICSAILTISIPLIHHLVPLLVISVMNGICLGFWEAGSNVFIMKLWGKDVAAFLQVLQLMFGVGSIVAPLIAEPFLIREHDPQQVELLKIFYPYAFVALSLALNAVMTITCWYFDPVTTDHPSRNLKNESIESPSSKSQSSTTTATRRDYDRFKWKALAVLLLCVIMPMHVGGFTSAFGSFLLTFAVNCKLQLSKAVGAHLTTLFWTTFTFTRLISIVTIEKIGTEVVIIISLSVMLISNVLLLPFGDTHEILLFIGVGMFGMGLASLYGSIFAYAESFFPLTSTIGSLMVVSGVIGEFVFPTILSSFIESSPTILLWMSMSSSLVLTISFLAAMIVCNYCMLKY
jgi:fucose permease